MYQTVSHMRGVYEEGEERERKRKRERRTLFSMNVPPKDVVCDHDESEESEEEDSRVERDLNRRLLKDLRKDV